MDEVEFLQCYRQAISQHSTDVTYVRRTRIGNKPLRYENSMKTR